LCKSRADFEPPGVDCVYILRATSSTHGQRYYLRFRTPNFHHGLFVGFISFNFCFVPNFWVDLTISAGGKPSLSICFVLREPLISHIHVLLWRLFFRFQSRRRTGVFRRWRWDLFPRWHSEHCNHEKQIIIFLRIWRRITLL
jgi:hypothetical protein